MSYTPQTESPGRLSPWAAPLLVLAVVGCLVLLMLAPLWSAGALG